MSRKHYLLSSEKFNKRLDRLALRLDPKTRIKSSFLR